MLINIDNNYIFFSPKSRTTGKVTKDCRDAKEPSIKTNVGPGKLFAVRTAPNQHRIKEVIIRQKNIIIKHRKKIIALGISGTGFQLCSANGGWTQQDPLSA